MEINSPNNKPLSPEELKHLDHLKSVVEKALEDGYLNTYEIDNIKSIIWADGKITYEELQTFHHTIKAVMGDEIPEIEWRPNS